MKKISTILSFIILLPFSIMLSQSQLQMYKQFLESNKNLETSALLKMHPAGLFNGKVNLNTSNINYFDSISIKYSLSDFEKELLSKNGFMVSERLSYESFGEALGEVWHKDLPVFISTDAILHSLHMSYDDILKRMELDVLIPKVQEILQGIKQQLPLLEAKYADVPEMKIMLQDVDLYITMASRLLDNGAVPYYQLNNNNITKILEYIAKETSVTDSLFSSTTRIMDYSQFTVRGHYTDEYFPILAKYFQAMMWLGRTELYLLAPRAFEPAPTESDIQRQTIDALLIKEAIENANLKPTWDEVNEVLEFFVGKSDNVTLTNIIDLAQASGITRASELFDLTTLKIFQDTLKIKSYAFQRILSQIIMTGFNSPDSIIPASAFLLFGQRFIIDSYVASQVVFDKIVYNNNRVLRMLPKAQDILFTLGNDASAQLLASELDKYHYASNLAALRYLIDNYDDEFWNESLYNLWLNAIRKLNPSKDRSNLPEFMQTGAWWQEKMNTQLASWTQLRHDNLLYAKQSYSGGPTCSYPYAYLEPVPEFYKALKNYSRTAAQFFRNYDNNGVVYFFEHTEKIYDTLFVIAAKEINSEQLSEKEINFLKNVLYEDHMCGVVYNGWYPQLFYSIYNEGISKADKVVADIHTAPYDEFGNEVGWVVHAGTGPVNLGVFIAKDINSNQDVAFVGPVLSYYEYTSTNYKRLTDEEWKGMYNISPSLRPDWVNVYLADTTGNSRGTGLQLLTGVKPDDNPAGKVSDYLIAQNYPNPFNPSTIIRFSIPADISGSQVKLSIYNIQGELVKTLLNEILPSGNYLTRWDGTNDSGGLATSGIYFYNLNAGDKKFSGKMNLIK